MSADLESSPPSPISAGLCARVLNGRLAGAGLSLAAGRRLSIGHAFFHDIVLREDGAAGVAAEAEVDTGVVRLTVLAGDVSLLGARVPPDSMVTVPHYVPVRLGSVALAFGGDDEARWAEAAKLLPAVPPPENAEAVPVPHRLGALAQEALARARATFGGALQSPLAVRAALVVVAVVMAGPLMDEATGLFRPSEARAEAALLDAGFGSVDLVESGNRLVATGFVRDEGARKQVTHLLERAGVDAVVDVRTGAEVARAAADVARMHGVAASARWQAPGVLLLRTEPLERDERAALVEAVRRDVGDVGPVRLLDDLDAVDTGSAPASVSDAAKRVATVVAGDPGYIQTIDGARYFVGAVMPSGHVLKAIEGRDVVLERSGKTVRVTY
jgi:type III secretion protein D